MKWAIVCLYLPPPASLSLLNQIMTKITEFAIDNTVILGDFNLVPKWGMDRIAAVGPLYSGLAAWAETYGLMDVLQWRHPQAHAYTCHSASHCTFSQIDLAFAGKTILPRVTDIKILPRSISDHAPLLLSLDLSVTPADTLWRLSRFWISDAAVDAQFR